MEVYALLHIRGVVFRYAHQPNQPLTDDIQASIATLPRCSEEQPSRVAGPDVGTGSDHVNSILVTLCI